MSRAIDRLPELAPKDRRKLKVVVVSASRSGTLGLYKALKILGYNCYHIVETMDRGPAHQKAAIEAITAANNRLAGLKRYDRADFDKWLGEYDCVLEFPGCMLDDYLDAYLDEPDVKFILTERDPDAWTRSMNNTIAQFAIAMDSFPMTLFRKLNEGIDSFSILGPLMYYRFSEGTLPGQSHNLATLRKNYVEYIKEVKAKIPADRLKVIKLEEGLDWPDICPYLGHEIPKQPYPDHHTPEEFKEITKGYMGPRIMQSLTAVGIGALPIISAGLWFAFGNGTSWAASALSRVRRG